MGRNRGKALLGWEWVKQPILWLSIGPGAKSVGVGLMHWLFLVPEEGVFLTGTTELIRTQNGTLES